MIEKRVFERFRVTKACKIDFLSLQRLSNGCVIDVSETGLSFITNDEIKIVSEDADNFDILMDENCYKVRAKLKWVKRNTKGYTYGFFIESNKGSPYSIWIKDLSEKNQRGFFLFEVTVYLKDINIFGTGYFSRYFDWQGMAREEYFMTVRNYNEIFSTGTRMITKKAWIEYFKPCSVFERLILKIQNRDIKKASFEMNFSYIEKKSGNIIASGGQILVFTDSEGRIIQIPERILEVISNHHSA